MNKIIAGSGGCFRKGALVQLEGGKTKPIEELKVGDEVLSFDENGIVTKSVVTETHFHPENEPLLKVRFWQGETYITPNHWVLNAIKSFSAMGDLGIGEALVDGFGNLRPIISVEDGGSEPVYNLTVEPYHTFICDGIRVHNGGYRASYPTIGGSGGGGKKKKSKGITEAKNNLFSTSIVSVLDLIGEGQIGGLVNGAKSVFLDETVLQNELDDSYNFEDVKLDSRTGTQNQSIMSGYSDVESPHNSGWTDNIDKKNGRCVVGTISDDNADAVRFAISFPSLTKTNGKSGDIAGTSVTFHFEYKYNGGGWKKFNDTNYTVNGKTNATYQKQYQFTLPRNSGLTEHEWVLAIVRDTDDHESSLIQDTFTCPYYVVITNQKLNYPNSALVGITVSAEHFSSVPSRSYLVDGLKIRVPRGYTPPKKDLKVSTSTGTINTWRKAVYPSVWDGTFTTAVSSNPAWILFDLLTDKRYGLGNFISDDDIDVSALYKIAKYCDELVPDGYSYLNTSNKTIKTTEPRFQINTVIQQRTDAYSVISDICSAFRGMSYWSGGQVGFMADMPTDPTMEYTPANVIDGLFTYQGSARKDRHSVCQVTWNNPERNYQQEVEYIEDPELLDRYGIRETEMIDFGCTTRGQARRAGLWTLYTEKYESELISFEVGLDSALVMPGDIIKISDTFKAGIRVGGRLRAVTTNKITLDAEVEIKTGANISKVSLKLPDGKLVDKTIVEGAGKYTELTVTPPFSADKLPMVNSIWLVTQPQTVEPLLARVVSVKQKDTATFVITALEHNPSKYDAIEKGLALTETKTSLIDFGKVNPPTNLVTTEHTYLAATGIIGSKILVSWEGDAYAYDVSYRRVADGSVTESTISDETVETLPVGMEIGTTVTQTTDADGVVVTTTTTVSAVTEQVVINEEVYEEGEPVEIGVRDEFVTTLPDGMEVGTTSVVTTVDGEQVTTTTYVTNSTTTTVDGGETINGYRIYVTEKRVPIITIVSDEVIGYNIRVSEKRADYRTTDNWTVVETTTPSYEIENVQSGFYEIEVVARSLNENYSSSVTTRHVVEGVVARPGTINNFKVRVRTYDLYLTWDDIIFQDADEVEHSYYDVDGYEIRCGNSWDSAEVVAVTKSNYCVHDQSKAGTYRYMIRAIFANDEDLTRGQYSDNISTAILTLKEPAPVTDFAAVQYSTRIDFKWTANDEDNIAYYEIREGTTSSGGDGNWISGTHIADVMATSYSMAVGSVTGQRTFWIKAVASPGIYSVNAMFCRVNVTAPEDRNVIVEIDEAQTGWQGTKNKTYVDAQHYLELIEGETYGEYLFPVDLGETFNAQNSIVTSFDAVTQDTETWLSADYAWNSPQANRQWIPSGDVKVVDITYYISMYKGYEDSPYYEIFPLTSDVKGYIKNTAPKTATNASTFDSGRYLNGLKVTDSTVVDWNLALPANFNITFWHIPISVDGIRTLWTGKASTGGTMSLVMDGNDKIIYLQDTFNNRLNCSKTVTEDGVEKVIQPYPKVDDRIFFGISQDNSLRRLHVGILNGEVLSVSQTVGTNGTATGSHITTIGLY